MRKLFAALVLPVALFSTTAHSQAWDVSGVWDAAVDFVSGTEPQRGVQLATPGIVPQTQYGDRYTAPSTTESGGVPLCNNRDAVTQQSAQQYFMQQVAKGY